MKLLLLPMFLISLLLGACSSDDQHASLAIEHWETSNGMPVYFVAADEIPMLDIELVFDAGSARDGALPGLAQLTTTLLDDGSLNWTADDIATRFEEVGAQYGASSNRDNSSVSLRTLIEPALLKQSLETFIRVASQPSFPHRDFERAQKRALVGLQLQAQRPGDVAQKAFMRALYGKHPYGNPIHGTEAAVTAITRQDVSDFHKRYFNTDNAVLAMVGNLSKNEAREIAEQIATSLPQGEPAADLPPVTPLQEAKTIRIAFPSQQANIYIGQPGMKRGDEDYFTLYVGNHILGGSGFSSRILTELRSNRGLVYSAFSYFLPQTLEGPFMVGMQTRADQAEEAIEVTNDTIKRFIDKGPDKNELESSLKNITGGFPLRIDSNADILNYLATIGFYNLPLDYLQTFNHNVSAVDAKTIRKTFRKRLDPERMITVIVGGEADQDGDEES